MIAFILSIVTVASSTSPITDLSAALKTAAWTEAAPFAAIVGTEFAKAALSKDEATQATAMLWAWHAAHLREEGGRAAEWNAKSITLGTLTMKFDYKVFGEKPANGRSLYISMHGGGSAPAAVNESQWKNQIGLYKPTEGIYLAPRAPTDAWNMWHESHIDGFFGRLIEDAVLVAGVDPNRVYLLGYSAGGDGVYQLAPRMADRFAAASMMAGHPNESQPDGLCNLPFAIHVGEKDGAFDRNKIAGQWGVKLDDLAKAYPGCYEHVAEVHKGKGHWMDLEDAAALPWMARHTRTTNPQRVVWKQDDVTHMRLYWVKNDAPVVGDRLDISHEGNVFTVHPGTTVGSFTLLLSDAIVDLDKPLTVRRSMGEDKGLIEQTIRVERPIRTLTTIYESLASRADPAGVYTAAVPVDWAGVPLTK